VRHGGKAMRSAARELAVTALALSGAACCRVPYSAHDSAPPAARAELPGIVVIVDRARRVGGCTGTVVASRAAGKGFDSLVLTARHCVVNDDGDAIPSGVVLPGAGDEIQKIEARVYPASLAYAPDERETTGDDTIKWDEHDWALLRVHTPARLPVLRLYRGDPATDVRAGAPVALLSYADREYRTRAGWRLAPHEHRFRWRIISPEIVQGGHSGAPVVRDGEVVAVFTGYVTNSNACFLATLGKRWPTKLKFVNVATIRARAAAQGFAFDAAPVAARPTAR
jgi:V8-like Glu-specific endopeptidase